MKMFNLHAYWAENLGDDLMVRVLLERYPQCWFYCSQNTQFVEAFRQYPNFVDREKLGRKLHYINKIANMLTFHRRKDFVINRASAGMAGKCSATIRIGGSIFMQAANEPVAKRIRNEESMLKRGPLFIVGANFGPYTSEDFREAFSEFFEKCASVTFRDKASWELFAGKKQIQYAPDVVFNLPCEDVKNTDTVVISVIDLRWREFTQEMADAYESLILDICYKCIQDGKKPVLMSFCKKEGDECAIERILSMMEAKQAECVDVFRYNGGNLDDAIDMLKNAGSIVASRFHAMILALRFQKPFYCLAYSDKIIHVLNDLGSDAYIRLENVNKICADTILENTSAVGCIDEYVKSAEKQFAALDAYIKTSC